MPVGLPATVAFVVVSELGQLMIDVHSLLASYSAVVIVGLEVLGEGRELAVGFPRRSRRIISRRDSVGRRFNRRLFGD
jgi:hypothetical protein